jgi:hypothetical protein
MYYKKKGTFNQVLNITAVDSAVFIVMNEIMSLNGIFFWMK